MRYVLSDTYNYLKDGDRRHERRNTRHPCSFCDEHKILLHETKLLCEKIAKMSEIHAKDNEKHVLEIERIERDMLEIVKTKLDKDQHKGGLSVITTFGVLIIGALIALNIRFGTITGEILKAAAVEKKTIELLEKNLRDYTAMQKELNTKFLYHERTK